MDLKKLSDNIEIAIDAMAKKQICGVDLETASADFLIINDNNIDEAVMMQPTAIAYFTACMSQAKRNLDRIEFEEEIWRKEKFTEINKNHTGSSKLTKDAKEDKLVEMYKSELLDWYNKKQDAQQFFDNAESMYEGWKQKGYSLNQHAKLRNEEYNSGSGSIMTGKNTGAFTDDFQGSVNRARMMIRKKGPVTTSE